MSNRPSPLGWLTKFVVAPVSLAALGYYVIGPRVGGELKDPSKIPGLGGGLVAQNKPAPKPQPASNQQFQRGPYPSTEAETTPAPTTGGGPQVDVEVHSTVDEPRLAPVEEPKPKPRRKRKKKPAPAPVETPKPEPKPEAPTVLEPTPATPPTTDPPPTDQGGSGGAATAGGAGL